MIYQLEIGEFDNAYIFTEGITGLTEFEPVKVSGTANPVIISVDPKKDSIFTEWRKQSMQLNLLKENETDYIEILEGFDNDIFGVLIENGSLSLNGSDIEISNGGKLKFIGTLLLETYTEAYRAITPVTFTFHDGIGQLDDDTVKYTPFETNRHIYDIIAELVYSVQCSTNLYFEWPYIESSSIWGFVRLDTQKYVNSKRIEVLERIMLDFGLTIFVDFETNAQTKLVDCGAIRIIAVEKIPLQTYTYYNFTLSLVNGTYKSEYFYLVANPITEIKQRYLLGTDTNPLINYDANLLMERKASKIVAKNTCDLTQNLVVGGVFSETYVYTDGLGVERYKSFGYKFGTNAAVYTYLVNRLNISKGLFSEESPGVVTRYNGRGVVIPPFIDGSNYRILFSDTFFIIPSLNPIKFNVSLSVNGIASAATLKATLLTSDPDNYATIYYWDGIDWEPFTTMGDLGVSAQVDVDLDESVMLEFKPVWGVGQISKCMLLIYALGDPIQLKYATVQYVNEADITQSVVLNTILIGNNRKEEQINPVFMNRTNEDRSDLFINNLIQNDDYEKPLTLEYNTLDQTMLAHLSDIYGGQFNTNRFNLDCTFKTIDSVNLMGQYGLHDKFFMITSGDYDAKRKEFKGKLGEIINVNVDNFLLKDNFVPFTWDNGNNIILS